MTIIQVKKSMCWLTVGGGLFLLQNLLAVQANTAVLTNATLQEMTQEDRNAFNIQYQIEYKQHQDNYLALLGMRNPYDKLIDAYENANKSDDKELTNLMAKRDLFDECRNMTGGFIGFANSSQALTEGPGGMSKEKYMKLSSKHFDIDYPFTEKQRNESFGRFWQVFMESGWKYRGKGEENVFVFFNTCMNIPIALFEADYSDDESDDELEDELEDEEN